MQTSSSVFIVFPILLFLSLPSPSLSATIKCNPHDQKVLLEISAAFDNAFPSWNASITPDCCRWYGVKCDINPPHRVIQVSIFKANISGQIPDAVGDLPYLQLLVFHHVTNLTGQIPLAIAKLTNLNQLTLSYTNLTGPVPTFLTELKKLTTLDLSFNSLTGSIPPQLSQLHNLLGLYLDRNKLTGSIPESFGEFTGSIRDLYLSHNNLTGTVPKSLGNLNFTTLDFSRNKLEGDVSFLFGKNKTVQIVDLSRNLFEFNLSKVEFPDSLTSLDLNHNKIFGSLPEQLTQLNFQYLNVSYNRLCGPIPQGGKLQTFTSFEYFHNRCLCGAPLAACN